MVAAGEEMISKKEKKTVDPCALNPGYGILITTLKGRIETDWNY